MSATEHPALTVRAISAVGVEVPMTFTLGTSRGRIAKAPLLLIDLETEEGVTGRSYLWSYFPRAMAAIASLLAEVEDRVRGEPIVPGALWDKLSERFALIGVQGIVRMAMAGFDVACWDALAVAAGVPLVRMLGGTPRPVPAYNSCGLGLMAADALGDEAEKLLERRFRAIKLRLGYPTLGEDIAAVHAVKARLPDGVALMVDYNQALSVARPRARSRGPDLDRGADPPRRLRGRGDARP
jgi:mandelate racemase